MASASLSCPIAWLPWGAVSAADNSSATASSTSQSSTAASRPLGYALPAAELFTIRCDLLTGSAPVELTNGGSQLSAASASRLIATTSAAAVVMQAAVAVPRDIMIMRFASGSGSSGVQGLNSGGAYLESMRWRTSETVVLPACALQPRQQATNTSGLLGGGSDANADADLLAVLEHSLSQAVAAAAQRLLGRGAASAAGGAGTSSAAVSGSGSGSGAALTLSSSSTLVIALDGRASPHWPSPSQMLAQSRRAAFEALALPVNASSAAASSDTRFDSCTAAQLASAASALSGLPRPLRLAVYIGAVRANITWVAPDGTQIHVTTPTYAQLCGGSNSGSISVAGPGSSAAASTASGGPASSSCGYQRTCSTSPTFQMLQLLLLVQLQAQALVQALAQARAYCSTESERHTRQGRPRL